MYDYVPGRSDTLSGQDAPQSGPALLPVNDVESVHAPQPNLLLGLDHDHPKEIRCRLSIEQAHLSSVFDISPDQRPLLLQVTVPSAKAALAEIPSHER